MEEGKKNSWKQMAKAVVNKDKRGKEESIFITGQ